MSKPTSTPEERYENLVETFLSQGIAVQEGKGFGSAALKVKGKIFSMLVRGKLVIKLPKSRVDALVSAGLGTRFDPRNDGRLMKEWLVINDSFEDSWLLLAQEAFEFVATTTS